jgi:hypothetical protein
MSNPKEQKNEAYEAPKIIHEEVVEAIAAVCSSSMDSINTCRYSLPACLATST